jgi:hypothetical protein
MIRMIKNRARIGKRWLVVEGGYGRSATGRAIWRTRVQLSEHDEAVDARRAVNEAVCRETDKKD